MRRRRVKGGVERDEEEWRAKGKDGGSWRKGKMERKETKIKVER